LERKPVKQKLDLCVFRVLVHDLVVIAETEDNLTERLYEWKNNVESRGMRVNMNKTKAVVCEECQ